MDSLKVRGRIDFEIKRKDGTTERFSVDNLITNVGKAAIAGLVGNTGSITAFGYLALGTSNTAPAGSQTALGAEITTGGLGRASATVSRTTTVSTNDTLTLTYQWTASSSFTIQEIGVFNASSSGTMLGRALTGAKPISSTEMITGTYNVIFS